VQALHSPVLATLLHSTRAVGLSQTAAWYKEWNYGTFAPRARAQRNFASWENSRQMEKLRSTSAFDYVSF